MDNKYLKYIAKVLVAFMIVSIIHPFHNMNEAKAVGTDNSVIAGKDYEILDNISWSRTLDIKGDYFGYEGKYTGGFVDTRDNTKVYSFSNNYWTKTYENGTNIYTLDKTNNAKGILQTTKLFNYAYNKNTTKNKIVFDYKTLTSILEPIQTTNVWDGKTGSYYSAERINNFKTNNGIDTSNPIPSSYNDFATWFYMRGDFNNNHNQSLGIVSDETNRQRQGDQLRLFRGEFNLTQDEIDNYDYYIGIGENNPELILPIDDTMFVLVDEKQTGINFTTSNYGNEQSLYLKNNGTEQELKFHQVESYNDWSHSGGLSRTCSNHEHLKLSGYADGLHAHLEKYLNKDGQTIANISSILKDKGAGQHKIEIVASDYNLSGGMAKLQIIKVKKPDVTVEKEAIVDSTTIASSLSNGIAYTGIVLPNEKVDYKLSYKNNGINTLSDVVFTDETLGIEITKNSYKLNGANITDLSNLTITNGDITRTGIDALSLLSNLNPKTKITVTDTKYLTKTPSEGEIGNKIPNTLSVNSTYFSGIETGEKKVTVEVEVDGDRDVEIQKYIKAIIRDDNTIYNNDNKVSVDELPRIYAGDKMIFGFKVINNEKADITNLNLKDIVSLASDNSVIDNGDDFTFKSDSDMNFNGKNFKVPANSTIDFSSNEWVVPENARYILNNSISLLDSKGQTISDDYCDFKVYPKVYLKMHSNGDPDKQFYVTITGSDGFKTGMYLKDGETVELPYVDFGVDYVVKETIPMNYILDGIDIDGNNKVSDNLSFNLFNVNSTSTVNVYNITEDSTDFRDDDEVTNKLKIER